MRDKSNLDQIFQTYLETYYFTKGTLWTKKKTGPKQYCDEFSHVM